MSSTFLDEITADFMKDLNALPQNMQPLFLTLLKAKLEQKQPLFVTEQEKLFYDLGQKLGQLAPEAQKAYLQQLKKTLSVPTDHLNQGSEQNVLYHNRLEGFVRTALEKGIENAVNKAMIHSNSTAFFKGYHEQEKTAPEQTHSPKNSKNSG